MGSWPELHYIYYKHKMQICYGKKKRKKEEEKKKAIRLVGKGKERKRTLFYCQVF